MKDTSRDRHRGRLNGVNRMVPLLVVLASASLLFAIHGARAAETSTTWPEMTAEYRPWTYWWWMGSAVDEANLTRQLEAYQAAGLGGVHIVPIYGAKGYEDRFIDYLSPTWMDRLRHTVVEAGRLGLGVDMTTGTGWNFGGPTVTANDADAAVVHNVYQVAGGQTLGTTFNPVSTQALVAYSDAGAVVELTSLIRPDGSVNWSAPSGSWNVHHVSQKFSGRKVKRAAPGGAGSMINPFFGTAMTNYLVRFEDAFAGYNGPMPRAMYCDSYEYTSNWSPDLFDEFEQRRGYRLETQLPALFGTGSTDTVARVKSDYRRTISEIMTDNSIATWTTWV
ncbi:MAG: hypothetical protein GX621_01740, partial [Pirellulaceae bacterium]|nr:hypothetical protein [Pirellulaceae bacterium]